MLQNLGLFVEEIFIYIYILLDVLDDLLIPCHHTRFAERCQRAEQNLEGFDVVVGHSLGGAVALELAARHSHLIPITCGAPVIDFWNHSDLRFRHLGDPMAMFDKRCDYHHSVRESARALGVLSGEWGEHWDTVTHRGDWSGVTLCASKVFALTSCLCVPFSASMSRIRQYVNLDVTELIAAFAGVGRRHLRHPAARWGLHRDVPPVIEDLIRDFENWPEEEVVLQQPLVDADIESDDDSTLRRGEDMDVLDAPDDEVWWTEDEGLLL